MKKTEKVYVIGQGRLGGCWADQFWVLNEAGREIRGCAWVGDDPGRPFLAQEKEQLIKDYYKYRSYLQKELDSVIEAEQIVLNAPLYPPETEALILGDKKK